MDGWHDGYGWIGPFGMIGWVVVLALMGALAVWLFRNAPQPGAGRSRSPGLDVLETRYANGEINREEYLQKKKDLGA